MDRRDFLGNMTVGALASPFLGYLLPTEAAGKQPEIVFSDLPIEVVGLKFDQENSSLNFQAKLYNHSFFKLGEKALRRLADSSKAMEQFSTRTFLTTSGYRVNATLGTILFRNDGLYACGQAVGKECEIREFANQLDTLILAAGVRSNFGDEWEFTPWFPFVKHLDYHWLNSKWEKEKVDAV